MKGRIRFYATGEFGGNITREAPNPEEAGQDAFES